MFQVALFRRKTPPIKEKFITFVLGTGRSGTHLIGRIVGSHPYVKSHMEDPVFFKLSVEIANGRGDKKVLLPELIRRYSDSLKKSKHIILEKSHTNIWFAEELALHLQGSRFLGIIRDPYSTVSSMLKHEGVMHWFSALPQDQCNPFMGITADNVEYYKDLPLESKCALRWLAHKNEIERLKNVLPGYFVTDYNQLLVNQTEELKKLSEFLNIPASFKPEKIRTESLDKWKQNLTGYQINNIEKIIVKNDGEKYLS